MTHPNVAIVQSLDTAVPMILRGPSTSKSEETMFAADLELIRKFDAKGLELTGYPWAGDTHTRGGAIRSPASRRPAAAVRPRAGFRLLMLRHRLVRQRDLERWSFRRLRQGRPVRRVGSAAMERREPPGQGDFKDWAAFEHPTLGKVEIGGFNPKFYSQNPPPDMLETWARNEAMFNLYLAQQLPQVRILSAAAKKSGSTDAVFDVELSVTNEGKMPTSLEIARRVGASGRLHHHARGKGQRAVQPADSQPRQRAANRDRLAKPGENRRGGEGAGRSS